MQLGIPTGIAIANQLPLPVTDRAIKMMINIKSICAPKFLPIESRIQAHANKRMDYVSRKYLGLHDPRNIHAGGHEIDEVSGLALEIAVVLGVDALGPISN